MAQPKPVPPNQTRPWYYQNLFLIPAFILGWPVAFPFGILWPVWGLLMLRSPWHSHPLLKGLGWAMLLVGAVMFVKALAAGGEIAGRAIAVLIPGLLVTLVTQVMWSRYRLEQRLGGAPQPPQDIPAIDSPSQSRRSRARRRVQRSRGSRSGRAPQ